jgi:phenylacetate-CoA ligase
LVEVVDPKTGEPVEPEEEGVLVVTPLTHEAMPLLRYWTNDITFIYDTETCDCGRTMRKIARIKGRADDMLIINGVNVFPSAVEVVLLSNPKVSHQYQIVVEREGNLDRMYVIVESKEKLDEKAKEQLAKELERSLRETLIITPRVKVVDPGEIPRIEGGKAKRVIDKRKL